MSNINLRIPESVFEVYDRSMTTEPTIIAAKEPTFVAAFSSDKGPEGQGYVQGKSFYQLYGSNISFERHGQPLLQADRIIQAGGKILAKRIVADDALLANIALLGHIKSIEVQKTDKSGNKIYKDAEGVETIVAVDPETSIPNEAVNETKCQVRYEFVAVDGSKAEETVSPKKLNIDVMASRILNKLDETGTEGETTYPLFLLTDNGRGTSKKRFRIVPNYSSSRNLNYMTYNIEIIENGSILETLVFTLDPDVVDNYSNKSIQAVIKQNSKQLQCKAFDSSIIKFYEKIDSVLGTIDGYDSSSVIRAADVLFGKFKDSTNIPQLIVVDQDNGGINLTYAYGHQLQFGSNGAFGDAPITTVNLGNEVNPAPTEEPFSVNMSEYTKQLINYFSGEYTNDVFDLDNYRMDLIVDANYPAEVKKVIASLVTWRDDMMYFRDCGIEGLTTLEDILSTVADTSVYSKSRDCATYPLYYDVLDPYSKKQITVTVGYSLVRMLVPHFINGRNRPFAGQRYGITIPEAIEGSVNFIPKNTPSGNQKEQFIESKINYANYYDGLLTLETLYTSQEEYTQLSFINNVLAMQEVIKAVRSKCPMIRYSFIDNAQSLQEYKKDVQNILDNYSNNFVTLNLVYLEDETMKQNKVFYAAIQVEFKNFVQKEYFKLYAINSNNNN